MGSSSPIGSACLEYLLANKAYKKVKAFDVQKMDIANDKLEQHLLDFSTLHRFQNKLFGDDIFICSSSQLVGSKSKEHLKKADLDDVIQLARMAADNGVSQILVLSTVDADMKAMFFYNRLKGVMEHKLKLIPFWAIHIFRPSFVLEERLNSNFGQKIASTLGRGLDLVTGGRLTKYKPVDAHIVAKAMVQAAQKFKKGVIIYPSSHIQNIADEYDTLTELKK